MTGNNDRLELLVSDLMRMRNNLPKLSRSPDAHQYVLDNYLNTLERVRLRYGYCEEFVEQINWVKSYLGVEGL